MKAITKHKYGGPEVLRLEEVEKPKKRDLNKKMQYDKDLQSEHKELFLQARELLLSFNGIVENKKERITTYSNKDGGICHMRTMPYGVDFGFLKGAKMQDKLGLLTGKGKAIRVLKQTALDIKTVEYYLNQAIEINAKK